MPRERNNLNPDVDSPIVDDNYSDENELPARNRPGDIRDPEGDEGFRNPDIDEPYPSPEDDGDVYPVEDPPVKDSDTGDVNDIR
ncbi:MAG: hypothetical protein ABI878_01090 [Acidobacteriota bacterium]